MNVTSASAVSGSASWKNPQANPNATDRRFAELLASPSYKLTVSEDGTVLANHAAPSADGRCLEVGGKISTLPLTGFQMPQALQQEMATRTKEEALREEINFKYAEQHRYETVAQVFVNGKFAAEVNEAGGYGLQNGISGLSKASLSAQQRTQEIARALAGSGRVEIRTSNFEAGLGGWTGAGAPDAVLPAFTARSISEIFKDAREAAVRK